MLEDPFGIGEPICTFTNTCYEHEGLALGDGTVKIFVNAQGICGKINNELRSLGRQEGREEGRRELCVSMVRDGAITPALAAEKLGISEEEFDKILKEYENINK